MGAGEDAPGGGEEAKNDGGFLVGQAGLDDEAAQLDFAPGVLAAFEVSDAAHADFFLRISLRARASSFAVLVAAAKGGARLAPPRKTVVAVFGKRVLEFEQEAGERVLVGDLTLANV